MHRIQQLAIGGTSWLQEITWHGSFRGGDPRWQIDVRPEIDVSAQGLFRGPSGFQYEPQYAAHGAEFVPFLRCYRNSTRTEPNLSGGSLINHIRDGGASTPCNIGVAPELNKA